MHADTFPMISLSSTPICYHGGSISATFSNKSMPIGLYAKQDDTRSGSQFQKPMMSMSSAAPIASASEPSDCTISPISRRSAEHTSELQSLMRISYAVFRLKNKNIYTPLQLSSM